jgi:hypothetical protein
LAARRRPATGSEKPDIGKTVFKIFVNVCNNLYRAKINLVSGKHRVVMHHIAQVAFFFKGLFVLVGRPIFNNSSSGIVLVPIYHTLACYKTGQ